MASASRIDDHPIDSPILNGPRIPLTPPPAPDGGLVWALSDLWRSLLAFISKYIPPIWSFFVYEIPGYNHESQEHDNWCYAAVGSSISKFYDKNSSWDQCKIVNTATNRTDCCGGTFNEEGCNQVGYLHHSKDIGSLDITGTFDKQDVGAASFSDIESSVFKDRPVAVRHNYKKGFYKGGHFTVIVGTNRFLNS